MSDDASTDAPSSFLPTDGEVQAWGEMVLFCNKIIYGLLRANTTPTSLVDAKITRILFDMANRASRVSVKICGVFLSYSQTEPGASDYALIDLDLIDVMQELTDIVIQAISEAEILVFGETTPDTRGFVNSDPIDANMTSLIWCVYRFMCVDAKLHGMSVEDYVKNQLFPMLTERGIQEVHYLSSEKWPTQKAVQFIMRFLSEGVAESLAAEESNCATPVIKLFGEARA